MSIKNYLLHIEIRDCLSYRLRWNVFNILSCSAFSPFLLLSSFAHGNVPLQTWHLILFLNHSLRSRSLVDPWSYIVLLNQLLPASHGCIMGNNWTETRNRLRFIGGLWQFCLLTLPFLVAIGALPTTALVLLWVVLPQCPLQVSLEWILLSVVCLEIYGFSICSCNFRSGKTLGTDAIHVGAREFLS